MGDQDDTEGLKSLARTSPGKMSGFQNNDGVFKLIVWSPPQRITENRGPRTTFAGILLGGASLWMDPLSVLWAIDSLQTPCLNRCSRDFPGGTVVKNLPVNAGDMGLSPGLGRSHMPQSN